MRMERKGHGEWNEGGRNGTQLYGMRMKGMRMKEMRCGIWNESGRNGKMNLAVGWTRVE